MKSTTKPQLRRQLIAAAVLGACMAAMAPAHALNNPSSSVQMFRWKWKDIATECKDYLGPNGYGAVQVSPASASRKQPEFWYDVYQPVNYTNLESNMGTEKEFINMVNECHKAGVRVYADVVVNQMAEGSGKGTDGSDYSAADMIYPYFSILDFHEKCDIEDKDYAGNRLHILECRLSGMPDLNTGAPYVQQQISNYINKLRDIGVDGIRIDAAKHMAPADIAAFLKDVKPGTLLGEQFWITQEVIGDDLSKAADYVANGTVNEFKFTSALKEMFRKEKGANISQAMQILGAENKWGMVSSAKATVFVNNWDTERGDASGPSSLVASNRTGATNDTYLTWRYNLANILMLGWNYGHAQVHSGFNYTIKTQGPPSASPYKDGQAVRGSNDSWDFIHRWTEISNMVFFRATTDGQAVRNFEMGNTYDQVSFSRGDKGFVAINNDSVYTFSKHVQTGLSSGTYCNVAHGKLDDLTNACTKGSVWVFPDGTADITIPPNNGDTKLVPAVALHVNQKVK